MKIKINILFFGIQLLLMMCLAQHSVYAQQTYPVTTTTILTPPYSAYVSDYVAPGSNILKCNFVFNDFREPSWQVRLRLRIESPDLRLETRADFKPTSPITVTPGVAVPLSGSDLEQYFDFKNLTTLGSATAAFQQNGRFPEGAYTFCIEILDYQTGVLLSNTSCATAWIRLNDPPKVITPQCGAFIDPTMPLNIPIQWQLSNAISPNATLGTEYKLVVYEVTDPYANPFTSIVNGKVLQIFESDALTQTTFIYTSAMPALDVGKTYVYQIRAQDVGGRDLFKNNGLSEVCWFHYGYPENAKTTLLSPADEKTFKKSEYPYFRWSAPDLRLRNQPFIYDLKIVQLNEEQDPKEAIEQNPSWHVERTTKTVSDKGMDISVKRFLKPLKQYAWQVTTQSGNQTVARSEVRRIYGPPLVEQFYAGSHIIIVKKATSSDSLNFSGIGKVRVSEKDSMLVDFSGLKLKRIVNYWVLTDGEIYKEYENPKPILLQPKNSLNGTAAFHPKAFRFNKSEFALLGEVKWALPHAVKSGEVAYVTSEQVWLNYDKYKLLGSAKLSKQNQFELLDPYQFSLQLNPESDFLIGNDQFELRAKGDIQFPEKIKGKQKGRVKVPFPKTGQLFYFENLPVVVENDILVVENTRIYLKPKKVTIDLAEDKSPGNQTGNNFWKGVYIHEYDLQYLSSTDKFSQISFKKDVTHNFLLEEARPTNSWIDANGLNLELSKDFSNDALVFNSFAGVVNHLNLTVERNTISNSELIGGILIPVFSASENFKFTVPITDEGFRPGYLNDIEDKSFTFNKGAGEQEINLIIKRGVFADQRLIDMVIDLEWPAMSVTASAVTGFKAWGDYRIGFLNPNGGRALDQQLQGTLSGYPVTIDAISAGSGAGLYSFVASAKVQLSEDVSGGNGPPSINVYTIMPNEFVPESDDENSTNGTYADPAVRIQQIEAEYAATAQQTNNKLAAAENDIKNKAAETLAKLTATQTTTVTTEQPEDDDEEVGTDPEAAPKSGGLMEKLNPRQRQLVKEIVETLVAELTKPLTDSITAIADSVNARINREVNEVVLVAQEQVEDKVTTLVNTIAAQIIQAVQNDKVDVSKPIEQLADVVTLATINEVNGSLSSSVTKNITGPITTTIKVDIAERVNTYIRETASGLIIGTLDGTVTVESLPGDIMQGADTVIREIGAEVFDLIDFDNVTKMVSGTVTDAIRGISTDRIYNEIKAGASSIIENAIKDKVNELASKAVNQVLGDVVGMEIPVDFTTLASKLKDGNIQDIFALDPVPVKLKTKVLELNGLVHYQNDEPTYGDVWSGDIDVLVKVPKPFSLKAIYINGKKDNVNYWFAQITPQDGSSVKLGGVIPRKARELSSPIKMGVAKIVGVSGRVYHHMKDAPNMPIVPDGANNYGAHMNLVFFDQTKNGKILRLDVAGEINTATSGDYVLSFEGNLQLMSMAPSVTKVDPQAAIQGIFRFSYNSAEEHFLGYGRVEILKPGQLCASGSILVDTKPNKWRVEVGSRDDRIKFVPACGGWSPTGWMAITQSEAELGLGVQYSMYVKSPTLRFVVVKANVALDAGVAFGVQAAIKYDPKFALLRAGIWADLWADIRINYKYFGPWTRWKKFSVLSIYAKGDMLVIFEPKPSMLTGKLKGKVRLLRIVNIKFNTGFKKQLA